jgi:hypothetical protein
MLLHSIDAVSALNGVSDSPSGIDDENVDRFASMSIVDDVQSRRRDQQQDELRLFDQLASGEDGHVSFEHLFADLQQVHAMISSLVGCR